MLLTLDAQKGLFKDEACYHEFVKLFRVALAENSMPMVLAENQLLFTAISPDGTRQLLADRILRRFSENPELLTELKDRLERDEIVESE